MDSIVRSIKDLVLKEYLVIRTVSKNLGFPNELHYDHCESYIMTKNELLKDLKDNGTKDVQIYKLDSKLTIGIDIKVGE